MIRKITVFMLLILLMAGGAYAQEPAPTPDVPNTIEIDVDQAEDAASSAVNATETAAQATLAQTQRWLGALNTVPRNPVLQILFVIGGALLLVAGWRIYDWIMLLAGGLVGAAVMTSVIVTDLIAIELLVALLGFALGALLAAFVYYLAVFVIGAYTGILLAVGIAELLGIVALSPFVLLIAAIIGGGILVGFASELVIVIASVVGAQMIVLALALPAYWTLLLAVIGIAVQFVLARQFKYQIRRRPRTRVWRRTA